MMTHHMIPLWLKLIYTAFVAVLVPYYWVTYSAWNFLFFCDVALLIGVAALWTENPLLASLPTVGIAIPQLLWCLDFLTGSRITGMTSYMFDAKLPLFVSCLWTKPPILASLPTVGIAIPQFLWCLDFLTGARITGMTSYMFDPKLPLFVRGLSSFHGWLPFLLALGGLAAGLRPPGLRGLDGHLLPHPAGLVLPRPRPSRAGEQPQPCGQSQLRARPELRDAADRDAPAPLARHHAGRLPARLLSPRPPGALGMVSAGGRHRKDAPG